MSDAVADSCRPPGVDQLISTRLQLKVGDKVKLCFVCSGPPFFYLFVGRTAETEWVASTEAPVAKSVRDPPWMPKHSVHTAMEEMDGSRRDQVVVYEGRGPSAQDAVWTSGVTRIAWIDVTKRGKVRVPKNTGWHVHRRAVRHAALGGVTDATFSCFLVSRFEEDHEWRLLGMGIQSSLRQVVDPINGGRTVEAPREHGIPNTAGGLLQWGRRFGKVIVPTVYSKVMWAERRLTDIELADVLDLPGTFRKRLKPSQLAKVSGMCVPGKVVVALLESFHVLVTRTSRAEAKATEREAEVDTGDAKRTAGGGDLFDPSGLKRARLSESRTSEWTGNSAATAISPTTREKNIEPFFTVSDKATKSDDAPAPIHLFDIRVFEALNLGKHRRVKVSEALEVLRRFALRMWKRKVRSSFSSWSVEPNPPRKDADHQAMMRAGWDACRRVDGASCWDWDAG